MEDALSGVIGKQAQHMLWPALGGLATGEFVCPPSYPDLDSAWHAYLSQTRRYCCGVRFFLCQAEI